ncbi:TRAP transporter substrate-binding protein [Lentibacillus jeotgali]|uniref:TRAP transporter substrate-binding protein n=1 Tax=Lentibacillus jeotgali TaxID=558169 RepID=UPI00026283F8|nr:TRAP transporter substrate-binding protein DctP [Lentibacillus jeotgali]
MKTKISLLGVCLITVMFVVGCNAETSGSEKETHEIIMTHELPESFFKHDYMKQFKDLVEERSDGRLDVTIHPSGQLYTDAEAVQNLGTGSVHMVWPVSVHLETLAEEYGVVNLPFALKDEIMLNDPQYRKDLTNLLDSFVEDNGIKVLGLMRTAEGIILSNQEISKMSDLSGMKIRSVGGHVANDMLGAFGATATSMPATEITTSLSQGVIDGVNTSPDGWANVVGSAASHGFVVPEMQIFTYSIATDKAWFENLPEDLQSIIQETIDELIVDQWKESIELDKQHLEEITNDFGEVNRVSESKLDKWKEQTEEVRKKFEERHPEAMRKFKELNEGD